MAECPYGAKRCYTAISGIQLLCRECAKDYKKTMAENTRLRELIESELESMRKLVSEYEAETKMRPFAAVLKGKIAKYRTALTGKE